MTEQITPDVNPDTAVVPSTAPPSTGRNPRRAFSTAVLAFILISIAVQVMVDSNNKHKSNTKLTLVQQSTKLLRCTIAPFVDYLFMPSSSSSSAVQNSDGEDHIASSSTAPRSSSSDQPYWDGDVLIVGAGAAGLTAAYHLHQQRPDGKIHILEACSDLGGRLQKLQGFASFPIDLGGEWIHIPPHKALPPIVGRHNNNSILSQVRTVHYQGRWDQWTRQRQWSTKKHRVLKRYKWVNYTWHDFFRDHVAPSTQHCISYNSVVIDIRWGASNSHSKKQQQQSPLRTVHITTADGRLWTAQKVILTVPIARLQARSIRFVPPLPDPYQRAIATMKFLPGLKVFFKFRTRFYKPIFWLQGENVEDQPQDLETKRYFYDVTYGQEDVPDDEHVLGVFAVGRLAEPYVSLSDEAIANSLLKDLDEIYDGQATANLLDFVVQNWSREPHIGGAYIDIPNSQEWPIETLRQPIDKVLYFAGEAIPVDKDFEWGFAHGAALSGKEAAHQVLHAMEDEETEVSQEDCDHKKVKARRLLRVLRFFK